MGGDPTFIIAFAVAALMALAAVTYGRRVRNERRSEAQYKALQESGLATPATLHPVIDPSLCIGSGICTRSCPQGDIVLGLVAGRGMLVDPSHCIGHGECAVGCPTGAIRLVFGTAERGVDIPELNERFESNVPGLYITGELGGMGLIETAVRQSNEALTNIREALKKEGARAKDESGVVDVAIVGAGPAGLTAALASIQHGLTYRLLEQAAGLGGTILQYPRHKIVMTHPVTLPLIGKVFTPRMSKEELVALWTKATDEHGVKIENGVEVTGVERLPDGTFTVGTSQGPVRARKVMLCVGRRGKPRKLGVKGEVAANVAYSLLDPESYAGKRVLVVGGGDSALEAACDLAGQPGCRVVLSYRGNAFSRVKPDNRTRIERLQAEKKLKVLLESNVLEIGPTKVRLTAGAKEGEIPNDYVLVFAGGDPPTKLLDAAGVEMKRHHAEEVADGKKGGDASQVFSRIRDQQAGQGLTSRRAGGGSSWLMPVSAFLGGGAAAGLLWVGREYYFRTAGTDVPAAAKAFSPSGFYGHGMGFVALLLFLVNFAYLARKELAFMKHAGNVETWMRVHIVSGLFAGGFALFHSTLEARNLFAVGLYSSMGVVVVTGIVGRYLYGFVPRDPRGRPLAHAALVELSKRLEGQTGPHFKRLAATLQIDDVLGAGEPTEASLVTVVGRAFAVWPARYLKLRRILLRAGRELDDRAQAKEFRHYAVEMFKLRLQMEYFPQLKRLMAGWRLVHAALAVFLLAILIAHVTIDIWIGYRWIF
jgi:thioredoxin reductase/NAD-dependent dihydropyrimidine dehydrogenase PreA subunit